MTTGQFYALVGTIYIAPHSTPAFSIGIGLCFIGMAWFVNRKATGETE